MKNITSVLAVLVNMEIIDKLADYWYLLVFSVNVIIVIIGIVKDFKQSGRVKIENLEELERFGKDLKEYYEKHNISNK